MTDISWSSDFALKNILELLAKPDSGKLCCRATALIYILNKNKNYPGKIFHARVNADENLLLSNACLETWTIWPCGRAYHFGSLYFCMGNCLNGGLLRNYGSL